MTTESVHLFLYTLTNYCIVTNQPTTCCLVLPCPGLQWNPPFTTVSTLWASPLNNNNLQNYFQCLFKTTVNERHHYPQCHYNTLKEMLEFIKVYYMTIITCFMYDRVVHSCNHPSCPHWPWSDTFVVWLQCRRCVSILRSSSSWTLHVGFLMGFFLATNPHATARTVFKCFWNNRKRHTTNVCTKI